MAVKTLLLPDSQIAFLLVTGICSGMSLITCGFVVLTEGPSFRLTGDHDRQRFLAFVSCLAAVCGLLGNGLEEGHHGQNVGQSIVSFLFNWLVQVGLVVIVHNSIIRFLAAHSRTFSPDFLRRASRFCLAFYILPIPVLTPTIIALAHPTNTGVKTVARYMNIVFVCVVEGMAAASDIYLITRFTEHKRGGDRLKKKMLSEMWLVYCAIWFTICADIAAKITRNQTGLLIADLTITNLTISLRAVANLKYGATLRLAQEKYASSGGGRSNSHSTGGSDTVPIPLSPPPQKARHFMSIDLADSGSLSDADRKDRHGVNISPRGEEHAQGIAV